MMAGSGGSSVPNPTTWVLIFNALLFALLLVRDTQVFLRSPSRDSNGGVVPNIPAASSSSSTSWSSWKYDVFLSFCGKDTRKNFLDHFYYACVQYDIRAYKDDVTLDRGDTIRPALFSAIQGSQISVIIFSKNYAGSSWCLDELLYIMKCKEMGQIVVPIFYKVDPSDVRKQKGQFGEAFAKHELSENKNKVESWKKALVDAGNIAGWDLKHVANGHEAECIQEIVGFILDKIKKTRSLHKISKIGKEELGGGGGGPGGPGGAGGIWGAGGDGGDGGTGGAYNINYY